MLYAFWEANIRLRGIGDAIGVVGVDTVPAWQYPAMTFKRKACWTASTVSSINTNLQDFG